MAKQNLKGQALKPRHLICLPLSAKCLPLKQPMKQRGAALIIVMLVVALVAVLAVTMSGRLQMSVLRTSNFQQAEQAYWYWLSAEQVVKDLLQEEMSDNTNIATREQQWYITGDSGARFPVQDGMIAGRIRDLHSCFNLNALRVSGDGQQDLLTRRRAQFRLLLSAANPDIDSYTVDVITDSLVDWLDADSDIISSYGAEDADYQSLTVPYKAANTLLAHVSELRLIRGVTADIYNNLLPHVCVIPRSSILSININTLSDDAGPLLHAVTVGAVDQAGAQSALESRDLEGFDSFEEARNSNVLSNIATAQLQPNLGGGPASAGAPKLGTSLDDIGVSSEYFELNTEVVYGDLIFRGTSQLRITPEQVRVLYRGIGD